MGQIEKQPVSGGWEMNSNTVQSIITSVTSLTLYNMVHIISKIFLFCFLICIDISTVEKKNLPMYASVYVLQLDV